MFPNSGFYFLVLLFLVSIGFWPSYFSKLLDGINIYIHFHAITMLLWAGMLITQAFLIRFKKRSLHKLIGKFSYGLVPILILSLILLAHGQIEMSAEGIAPFRRYLLFLQLSLLTIFVMSYALAIINRHTPARHARYMICTAMTLIDPAVARIPLGLESLPFTYQVLTFALTDFILVVLIVAERNQSQVRKVFPLMLGIFLIFQSLNFFWTDSELWNDFSLWFASLPLT